MNDDKYIRTLADILRNNMNAVREGRVLHQKMGYLHILADGSLGIHRAKHPAVGAFYGVPPLYDYTIELGGFNEYNSPTYTRVALRMFNPDGGEFERSGNGLRVLASFLARRRPGLAPVPVHCRPSAVRRGTPRRPRRQGRPQRKRDKYPPDVEP